MKATRRSAAALKIFSLFVVCISMLRAAGLADEASSSRVRHLFKHPPTEYSTGPLWVWNDLLTEEEIRSTLHDLAS